MSLSTDQKYNVPGLDRALSIIELLNEKTKGLSVNEVAAILGLPINSVYRIMTTLERRKYVKKSKDGPGFILSEKLLQLATPVTGDPSFIESVIPYLYKLRDETRESMLAGTIVEEEGIVLEQIDGLHNFSFKVKPGLRFPLHTSAPRQSIFGCSLCQRIRANNFKTQAYPFHIQNNNHPGKIRQRTYPSTPTGLCGGSGRRNGRSNLHWCCG